MVNGQLEVFDGRLFTCEAKLTIDNSQFKQN